MAELSINPGVELRDAGRELVYEGFEVLDFARGDLERVRGIVGGEHRSVAVDDDAARGWCLRFPAGSLRAIGWFFVRLDAVPRDSNRNDRSGGNRFREISWRLRSGSCLGSLLARTASSFRRIRYQSFH